MNKFVDYILKGVGVAACTVCTIAIGAVEIMKLCHEQDNELSDISEEKPETVFKETEEA